MSEGSHVSIETACKTPRSAVSWVHGDTHLENEISAQPTVVKLREITTRNGCKATLIFCDHPNPGVRREVAALLLRSFQKRSEAT